MQLPISLRAKKPPYTNCVYSNRHRSYCALFDKQEYFRRANDNEWEMWRDGLRCPIQHLGPLQPDEGQSGTELAGAKPGLKIQ